MHCLLNRRGPAADLRGLSEIVQRQIKLHFGFGARRNSAHVVAFDLCFRAQRLGYEVVVAASGLH
jgi:hypothetical protein